MAKRGKSVGDRLEFIRDFYEDVRECCPELMPFFYREPAKKSAALLKAADYFKIELDNKTQSAWLLRNLAEVVFPEKGREKGSKYWGFERLSQLSVHWIEVDGPQISDSEAARKIKKRYPKQYQSADAIRPQLNDARLMSRLGRDFIAKSVKPPKDASDWTIALNDLGASNEILGRYLRIMLSDLKAMSRKNRRDFLKKYPSMMGAIDNAKTSLRAINEKYQKLASAGSTAPRAVK